MEHQKLFLIAFFQTNNYSLYAYRFQILRLPMGVRVRYIAKKMLSSPFDIFVFYFNVYMADYMLIWRSLSKNNDVVDAIKITFILRIYNKKNSFFP